MVTHKTSQFRTVVPPLATTVGKCKSTTLHPHITMRMLCGKIGQKSGNTPVKF